MRTGDYALFNLAVDWEISDNVSVLATVKNIADGNYTLVDGFPEEGRNFSLSLRLKN
jgi:iron complex outermembrane receptor protein